MILIFGGLFAWAFGTAYAQTAAVMVGIDPTLATNPGYTFLSSIWTWAPVFVIIGIVILMFVNSRYESEKAAGVYYA